MTDKNVLIAHWGHILRCEFYSQAKMEGEEAEETKAETASRRTFPFARTPIRWAFGFSYSYRDDGGETLRVL